jgi:hypothetical protein
MPFSELPFTDQQVLEELKNHGITTLDELARKIAEQSAAKAQWDQARGISAREGEADYLWTGSSYSLWHSF